MKRYYIQYNVGKVRYLVNYHNGIAKHDDGSDFFDMAAISNKVKLKTFIDSLVCKGYKEAMSNNIELNLIYKQIVNNSFYYPIIKHNYKELSQESTNKPSEWEDKKYAFILKYCLKRADETIELIIYSDSLEELNTEAIKFKSWYNYPLGLYRELQGNILQLA